MRTIQLSALGRKKAFLSQEAAGRSPDERFVFMS